MGGFLVNEGVYVEFTAASALTAGDVVTVAGRAGVVTRDYASGDLAAARVAGIFEFNKDNSDVTAGATVYWDTSAEEATTTSNSDTIVLGRAVAAAGASEDLVEVQLDPNAPTA